MTLWSFFGIHRSTYLLWIAWQGLAAIVASGFTLRTLCTRALGFASGDLLRSSPRALPLGFALLGASSFVLGTCCAHGLGFA
jgi:hypothetical protein